MNSSSERARRSPSRVLRGLFSLANTRCVRSQKNRVIPSYRSRPAYSYLSIPRGTTAGFGFRIVKQERAVHRSSISLSTSPPSPSLVHRFFVRAYYSSPLPLPLLLYLLPLPSTFYSIFARAFSFAPRRGDCFRIGESWEQPVAISSWIAITSFRREESQRRFLSITESSVPMRMRGIENFLKGGNA